MDSYHYRLTTEKCREYLRKELAFIDRNYNFPGVIYRKISFFLHLFYWQGLFKLYRALDVRLKKRFDLPFFIHRNKIEIEITTECNMRCYHCDRSCRQAPSKECMSTDQIRYFIRESIKTGKKWPFIVIIGGEPTLHPDIYEICSLLIEYKREFSPNTKLTISTNGVSSLTKQVLASLPSIIHQENSSKSSIENAQFYTFNVAPIDLEKYNSPKTNFAKACSTASTAGSALTRYGYYACGAAASIDRVLGLNIGIKSLEDITEKKFRVQLKALCGYCGFFKKPEDEIYSLEDMSPTWYKLYENYRKAPPLLGLYGENINEKEPVS